MAPKVKSTHSSKRSNKIIKEIMQTSKGNKKTNKNKKNKLKAACCKKMMPSANFNIDHKSKKSMNEEKSDATNHGLHMMPTEIDLKKCKPTKKNSSVKQILECQSQHKSLSKKKKLQVNHKKVMPLVTTNLISDHKQKKSNKNFEVSAKRSKITNEGCHIRSASSQPYNRSKINTSQVPTASQIKTEAIVKVENPAQITVTNDGLTACSVLPESQAVAMVQVSKTKKATVDVLSETATLAATVGQVEANDQITAASCGIVAKHGAPARRAFKVVNVIGFDEPSAEFVFPMLQIRTNKSNKSKATYSTGSSSKKVSTTNKANFKELKNKHIKLDNLLKILDRTIGTTVKMLKLIGEDS